MPQIVPPTEGQTPENPGVQIVRWLRPAGCVLVLLLTVLMLVFCFTQGKDPIPGYEPPHDAAYYAQHLPELAEELNARVLPAVDETASATADGGTVTVRIDAQRLAVTRAAVLRYYDASLFVFESVETTSEN